MIELKIAAVESYLHGKRARNMLAKELSVNPKTIIEWVQIYRMVGISDLMDKREVAFKGGNPIMTKGRVTTLEERIRIATYCIANNRNYKETSAKFQVSYRKYATGRLSMRKWVLMACVTVAVNESPRANRRKQNG